MLSPATKCTLALVYAASTVMVAEALGDVVLTQTLQSIDDRIRVPKV